MSKTKNGTRQSPAGPSLPKKLTTDLPVAHSQKKGLWQNLFGILNHNNIVASLIASLVATAVSAVVGLNLIRDPSVRPFFVVIPLTTVIACLVLFSLQAFFDKKDLRLSASVKLHFVLFCLFLVTVTVPLTLTHWLTSTQTNELLNQIKKVEQEIDSERIAQAELNKKRLNLYRGVTGSMTNLLSKPHIASDDLRDILRFCLESIRLNKPQGYGLRATVVYLDSTGKRLVMPAQGYDGFDRDIKGLHFDVSDRLPGEDDETYRRRLGVAGWTYFTAKPILDDDVHVTKIGEEHRYKAFPASAKEQDDRSMICIGIPNLEVKEKRFVGVLSISSPTSDVFRDDDLAIAGFFATLLGRFKTPVENEANDRSP